jgi:hypothetical protein
MTSLWILWMYVNTERKAFAGRLSALSKWLSGWRVRGEEGREERGERREERGERREERGERREERGGGEGSIPFMERQDA